MKSALHTTLIMAILAAVSAAAAIYYYPWPEFAAVDEKVGKPLFEEYSAGNVRGIDIMNFNSDKGSLDRITLSRRGERWLIPAKQNFLASETRRIGSVINSLNGRTVFEVISENQEDHLKYGVVDPIEYSTQRPDTLGTKLSLTDRNNKKIAELIVGSALKNDRAKRYVRIPGKPRVYTVEFNSAMLATDFALWNSANALRLQTQEGQERRQISEIQILNYRLSDQDGERKKSLAYQASLGPANNRLGINSLVTLQGGKPKKLMPTPAIEAKLSGILQPLVVFFTDDAQRKDKAAAATLIAQDKDDEVDSLAAMNEFGFYAKDFSNGQWQLDSENGQIRIFTNEGVVTTISIGGVGPPNSSDSSKLNYYVVLTAGIDGRALKKPIRPAGVAEDESDENKAYLRAVASWEKAIEKARRIASELNVIHGEWYYLVSEDFIKVMRPDLSLPGNPTAAAADNTQTPETPPAQQTPDKTDTDTDAAPAEESEAKKQQDQ